MEILLAILAILGLRAATRSGPAPSNPPVVIPPGDPRLIPPTFEYEGNLYNLLGQRIGEGQAGGPDNLYNLPKEFAESLAGGDGRYVQHPNRPRWWLKTGELSRYLYQTPPHLLVYFSPYLPRQVWTVRGGSETPQSGTYSTDGRGNFYVYIRQSAGPFWIEFKILGRLRVDRRWVIQPSAEWAGATDTLGTIAYLFQDAYNGITAGWPQDWQAQFDPTARPVIPP